MVDKWCILLKWEIKPTIWTTLLYCCSSISYCHFKTTSGSQGITTIMILLVLIKIWDRGSASIIISYMRIVTYISTLLISSPETSKWQKGSYVIIMIICKIRPIFTILHPFFKSNKLRSAWQIPNICWRVIYFTSIKSFRLG